MTSGSAPSTRFFLDRWRWCDRRRPCGHVDTAMDQCLLSRRFSGCSATFAAARPRGATRLFFFDRTHDGHKCRRARPRAQPSCVIAPGLRKLRAFADSCDIAHLIGTPSRLITRCHVVPRARSGHFPLIRGYGPGAHWPLRSMYPAPKRSDCSPRPPGQRHPA